MTTNKLINEIQKICENIKLEPNINNSDSIKSKEFIQKTTQDITGICQDIETFIVNDRTLVENAVDQNDIMCSVGKVNSLLVNLETTIITYNHKHPKNRFTDTLIHSITDHHKQIDTVIQSVKTARKNQELLGEDSDGMTIAKIFNCCKLEIPDNFKNDFKRSKGLIKKITLYGRKNQPAQLRATLIEYGLCDNADQVDKVAKQLIKKFFVPTPADQAQSNQHPDNEEKCRCEASRSLDFLTNGQ